MPEVGGVGKHHLFVLTVLRIVESPVLKYDYFLQLTTAGGAQVQSESNIVTMVARYTDLFITAGLTQAKAN